MPTLSKVMVVSSRKDVVSDTESLLISEGVSVYTANRPDNAAKLIKENKIEATLIDIESIKDESLTDIVAAVRPSLPIFLCNASEYSTFCSELPETITEVLRLPLAKPDLLLALKRVKGQKHKESQEKFSFVRQIIQNMSLYIEKIAEHVQGGIKYIDDLPYCVSIHDTNGTILYTNNNYIENFGEKTGCSSSDIYPAGSDNGSDNPVMSAVRQKKIVSEKRIVSYRNGLEAPVFVHAAPILDAYSEPEFVIEVFAGTQELDQMARDISDTQQNYHQLFNAVPSYIAVLNRSKEITAVNPRFREDFGDLTGRAFFDVLKPSGVPVDNDPVSLVMKDSEAHQEELVLTSEDGRQYNMMTWAAPVKTPTGKLLQILVVMADKTEMRTLKDNLSSLGLMLGTLSHNLKGSLTGLDAGLYLIDTGFYRNKPARIEEGLDVSKLMVDRIRKMIFNVLYYAKDRGINYSNVNILQFANDVAAHVENRIRGGNISFECEFPEEDLYWSLDPDLLRSALINILENAREVCISDQAEKTFQIRFKVYSESKDLVFEIHDNGIGMDEDQQKQIFSIFSSSKGLKGTGLGLFITKEVIRKHNGTISVQSEQGVGTCFSIKIPKILPPKDKTRK